MLMGAILRRQIRVAKKLVPLEGGYSGCGTLHQQSKNHQIKPVDFNSGVRGGRGDQGEVYWGVREEL